MVNFGVTAPGRCSPPVKTTVPEVSFSHQMRAITTTISVPPPVNFPVVSGGFALLATTGGVLVGLGGPAAGAAGLVTLGGVPGVVAGLMPLAAAGVLGRALFCYHNA